MVFAVLPVVIRNVPPVIGVPDLLMLISGRVVLVLGLATLTVPFVIEKVALAISKMELELVPTVPAGWIASVPPEIATDPPDVFA